MGRVHSCVKDDQCQDETRYTQSVNLSEIDDGLGVVQVFGITISVLLVGTGACLKRLDLFWSV